MTRQSSFYGRDCHTLLRKVRNDAPLLLLGAFVLVVDQLSKQLFFDGILNTGGIWGVGRGMAWEVLMVVGLGILIRMLIVSKKIVEKIGLILIASAGLSNLIDRFLYEGVRDFIFWPILNVYGNVADVVLVVGVVTILWEGLVGRHSGPACAGRE